jgi:hypothetical protein
MPKLTRNITTTVNSSATGVGTNSSSYHSSLLICVPTYRVRKPPTNGMPRKMTIARNTWVGVTSNVSMPATSVSIGGYGKKTGESDLLFVEGPTTGGERPYRERHVSVCQLELCLEGLEARPERRGTEMGDGLQLTRYLAEICVGVRERHLQSVLRRDVSDPDHRRRL